MSISIYNTLTHNKQPFVPVIPGKVGIYACGLTPQGPAHLGHMRGALAFDVIRRWFEYRGYDVRMVQNFTDIDDKIIRKAAEEGVSTVEVATRYSNNYLADWKSLSIKPVEFVKVTENMESIIDLIGSLVERGHAYVADNHDVYFSVSTFPEYGKLSRRRPEEMESGSRIDVDPSKRDPLDFALWKAERPGEPSWPSPWGLGRPGWHIECSALSMQFLGTSFDIHAGGIDLLFPHHENEIAQGEAGTGRVPFARVWMHWGSVNAGGEKMSKSLGNFFTIKEILSEYPAQVLRLYLLSTHYRAPIDYAPERLAEAAKSYDRIRKSLATARQIVGLSTSAASIDAGHLAKFEQAMDDDFNSAAALGSVFEALSDLNKAIGSPSPSADDVARFSYTVESLLSFLGVDISAVDSSKANDDQIDRLVEHAIAWRKLARDAKQYSLSDRIRDDLKAVGITLEDRQQGTTWHRE
jgi:cysteinyl-tRNA synthetase